MPTDPHADPSTIAVTGLAQAVSRTVPVSVLVADTTGRIVHANREACALFGLEEGEICRLRYNDPFWGLTDPDGAPLADKELGFRRVMETGQPVRNLRFALNLPGRARIHSRVNLVPLRDEAGALTGVVASFVDLTREVETERRLKQERALAREYVNLARVLLGTIDREGRIVMANRKACETLGMTEARMLGLDWFDLACPESIQTERREQFHRWMRGEEPVPEVYEAPLALPSGEVRHFRWQLTPLQGPGGRTERLLASGEDVTEQRRAEEELLRSHAKYRTLVEQLREGVWTFTADLETSFVNPRLSEMLGYTAEEMMGRRMCAFTDPEMAGRCRELLLEPGSAGTARHDMRFYRKDGHPVDAQLSVSRFSLPEEEEAILVCVTDVTRRREAEERLREANQKLEAALEELNATQKGLIRQERLSALGEMASGIAHDFNNRLQMILGFADLLETDPEGIASPDTVKATLDKIRASAISAAEVVGRLREFYRRESENDTWRQVDLNKKVELAIYLSEPKWRDRSLGEGAVIEIRKDLGPLPPVDGNPRELQEALVNLIFNAVDAMPRGGTVSFRTWTEGEEAVLEIADTGKGMDEETVARCFEPFFTTKGPDGSGMGLSVVHGILRRHGARLEVESRPGEGTRFRFRFPAAAETARAEAADPAEAPDVRAGRILVVDDEEPIRRIIARHLSLDGHEVVEAGGGPKALDLLGREDFDLVLTDRAMPVVTGLEVAKAAKARNPATPVILFSGFGTLAAQGGLPEGVDRFIPKPLHCRELLELVAELLGPSANAGTDGGAPED